jgi:hypothetical protein
MRTSEALVRGHTQTVEVVTRLSQPESAGRLPFAADSGLPAPDPLLARLIEQVEEAVREVQRREEETRERESRSRREETTRPTPQQKQVRYNVD